MPGTCWSGALPQVNPGEGILERYGVTPRARVSYPALERCGETVGGGFSAKNSVPSGRALAGNPIRAGHGVCRYAWRVPPRRSGLRMSGPVFCSGSVIGVGNGCGGRAFAMPWWA